MSIQLLFIDFTWLLITNNSYQLDVQAVQWILAQKTE